MNKPYEVHITMSPVFGLELQKAKLLVSQFGFKMAELIMQKDRNAAPERSDKDTFCTGHFTDHIEALSALKACKHELERQGFDVWRGKIEHIIYDERYV